MIKAIKNLIYDNILNDSAFRISYFINLFLFSIIFLDIVSVFFDAVIMIWAYFILKDKFKRNDLNIKYLNLILLFIFFSLITAILHIGIGFPMNFLANLLMIYHAVICFFIFYGMYMGNEAKNIKRESILIFKLIVILTTIFTSLSFIMLLFRDSFTFEWDMPIIAKYEHVIGIVKSQNSARFTGLYTNPNILAFNSAASVIFCHILYRSSEFLKKKKKWLRVLSIALLTCINLTAIILSDSIASFLFLVIYLILWLFYKLMIENQSFPVKSLLKKGIIFLFICTILIFGMFTIRSLFQSSASNIIDEIYSVIAKNTEKLAIGDDIHFGRPNHDIREGSGRRRLLEQALVIFSKHPILGIGNTNIVDYGKMYFESGIAFPNFHNGYVSILVCNGLIGFIIFITLLILILLKLINFLFIKCPNLKKNIFANLFVTILSYLIFALFEKTILSEINFMGVFFWLILGYAVSYMHKYGEYNCENNINFKEMLQKKFNNFL